MLHSQIKCLVVYWVDNLLHWSGVHHKRYTLYQLRNQITQNLILIPSLDLRSQEHGHRYAFTQYMFKKPKFGKIVCFLGAQMGKPFFLSEEPFPWKMVIGITSV